MHKLYFFNAMLKSWHSPCSKSFFLSQMFGVMQKKFFWAPLCEHSYRRKLLTLFDFSDLTTTECGFWRTESYRHGKCIQIMMLGFNIFGEDFLACINIKAGQVWIEFQFNFLDILCMFIKLIKYFKGLQDFNTEREVIRVDKKEETAYSKHLAKLLQIKRITKSCLNWQNESKQIQKELKT